VERVTSLIELVDLVAARNLAVVMEKDDKKERKCLSSGWFKSLSDYCCTHGEVEERIHIFIDKDGDYWTNNRAFPTPIFLASIVDPDPVSLVSNTAALQEDTIYRSAFISYFYQPPMKEPKLEIWCMYVTFPSRIRVETVYILMESDARDMLLYDYVHYCLLDRSDSAHLPALLGKIVFYYWSLLLSSESTFNNEKQF